MNTVARAMSGLLMASVFAMPAQAADDEESCERDERDERIAESEESPLNILVYLKNLD